MTKIERTIKIPENVEIEVSGYRVKVKGPKGEIEREFKIWKKNVKIEKKNGEIVILGTDSRRKTKAMVGTVAAHIKNMIKGVTKGFVYKLKIVYSHFPIKVELKENKLYIRNFLGENSPRVAQILPGVKVEIKGQDIILKGIDIEAVGNTANNIEQACRIVGYDRRRFIDGIYIYYRGIEEE